jgi:hypothetical protein
MSSNQNSRKNGPAGATISSEPGDQNARRGRGAAATKVNEDNKRNFS